jgi:hypothetical protein
VLIPYLLGAKGGVGGAGGVVGLGFPHPHPKSLVSVVMSFGFILMLY